MKAMIMVVAGWGISLLTTVPVHGQTTFTYQGQLKDAGAPASGSYDLVFRLFGAASGGSPVGFPATVNDWPVTNGLFSVSLDFGASPFDGNARWLQVEARPGTSNEAYTVLTPRQPLTAAPYALFALKGPGGSGPWATTGDDTHNTNAGNVGIGTTTPAASLHVAGDIRSDGPFGIAAYNPNNPGAVAALGWFNDVARIRIGGNGAGAGGGLDIQKSGDRSLMRLDNDGNAWFRGGLETTGSILANGDLGVRGAIDMGYEVVRTNMIADEPYPTLSASCPPGKRVLGGGCKSTGSLLLGDTPDAIAIHSFPIPESDSWSCVFVRNQTVVHIAAYAICASLVRSADSAAAFVSGPTEDDSTDPPIHDPMTNLLLAGDGDFASVLLLEERLARLEAVVLQLQRQQKGLEP